MPATSCQFRVSKVTAWKRDVSEGEGSLVGKARSSKDAQSDSWKETDCKEPVKPTQEADASAELRLERRKRISKQQMMKASPNASSAAAMLSTATRRCPVL